MMTMMNLLMDFEENGFREIGISGFREQEASQNPDFSKSRYQNNLKLKTQIFFPKRIV